MVRLFKKRTKNYFNSNNYSELVKDSVKKFKKNNNKYKQHCAEFEPFGDYLSWSVLSLDYGAEGYQLDAEGFPKVFYNDDYYYNPVTIAEHALILYGKHLSGEESKEKFIAAADKLLAMLKDDGSLRYEFSWRYYLNNELFEPGWVSGMAQGHALSVFSRAYYLTKNNKYFEAGEKALNFLITPIDQGGTLYTLKDLSPQLVDSIIFEEYITHPATYTLNGYMYTMLGLYSWSELCRQEFNNADSKAKEYFDKSLNTLVKILPYYDIGGFTSYDLGHITHNTQKPHVCDFYHGVHISLLYALYSITKDQLIEYYKNLWERYIS